MATSDVPEHLQTALGSSYILEREIGRGGMATVYLARDTKHGRPVALKVLHTELAASLGPERFRREIDVAARLQHPHILSVLDSGATPSGQLWFTMMYVDGESLRDRLRREHQLPVDEAVRITREVALALHHAHGHAILHRDIKPENVLLTRDGSTLVADFGIARALDVPLADTGERLTGRGMVVGTPQYMSPEQAAGERDIGPRSDVYSMAVIAYEMLAGEPPFTGPTAQAAVAKMMSGAPPSVRRTRSTVPEAVDVVLRRALAPVPADRFASALEFSRALETAERSALTTAASPPAVATPAITHRSRRVPAAAALLGLGFLVGVGVLFAWRRREVETTPTGQVSLAVLPFDSEGDTANGYFADGITDEIRGKLSALPALQVIARTSSNEYRHTTKAADQIGRELGVQYLLTGTVQWERAAGGARRVRVSPELVQVSEGHAPVTRWQQSYDTTLADVFDVQSAVATRVADKLGVVLSPPAQTQLAARPTQNLSAYDAYLRSTINGSDPATIRRGLAAADQAVALDSNFAAAWARVSLLNALLYVNSTATPANAHAAHDAAERAIALAPNGADGYIARAVYELSIAFDPAAARAASETAVRLAPSSSDAMRRLANTEAAVGQWAPALAHARQAAALDPRSPNGLDILTRTLLWLRRYPEGRAAAERAVALEPADLSMHLYRVISWLGQGDLAGARTALQDVSPTLDRSALAAYVAEYFDLYWALDSADRALVLTLPQTAFDDDPATWGITRAEIYWLAGDTLHARRWADTARAHFTQQIRATPDDDQQHLFLGLALAYLGQRTAATREAERALALSLTSKNEFLDIPYARQVAARIYVAAGDHPRALDQLDSLLAKPYFVSPAMLKIDPTWTPLKDDPRFEQLLTRSAAAPTA